MRCNAREQFTTRPKENFFDQRVKTLRPIDQRYPYEVHNKAWQGHHTICDLRKRILCHFVSSSRPSWTNTPGSCAAPGRKNTRPSPTARFVRLLMWATQPAVRRWWSGVPMCRSLGLLSSEKCRPSAVYLCYQCIASCQLTLDLGARESSRAQKELARKAGEQHWQAWSHQPVSCNLGKPHETAGCAREEVQPAREGWRLIDLFCHRDAEAALRTSTLRKR